MGRPPLSRARRPPSAGKSEMLSVSPGVCAGNATGGESPDPVGDPATEGPAPEKRVPVASLNSTPRNAGLECQSPLSYGPLEQAGAWQLMIARSRFGR
jgi:hypothetical protein